MVAAVARDPGTAPLPSRPCALVAYAIKLTTSPHLMARGDIESLRQVGLSDAAIHDAAAIVSYFNFVNRMALGLGVELEAQGGP